MPDEPTQTPPPDEKPEEKPAEENPNPPTSSVPSPPETSAETPPPAEEPSKTLEPQPENPPQTPEQPESPSSPESPKAEEPQKEEKPPEEPKPEPEKPQEEIKPPEKEVPVITQEDVDKQIAEKLKQEQDQRRKLANEARAKKKNDNLERLLSFAKEKKVITNDDARDFLHVSQSTATNYLSELVKRGSLRREGTRGGTKYSA